MARTLESGEDIMMDEIERHMLLVSSSGERLLSEAFERLPDPLGLIEGPSVREMRLIALNGAATRIVGLTRERALGRGLQQLLPPSRQDWFFGSLARCLASGEAWSYRTTLALPQGRRYLEVSLTPLAASATGHRRVLLHGRDITDVRRLQEQLDKHERIYRAAVESSHYTIARYDRQCRRVFANAEFIRSAGVPLAELLDKTPLEYPGGPAMAAYQGAMQAVLAQGEPDEYELRWQDSKGSEHCTLIRLTPEFDEDGEVVSVLSVGHDITEAARYRHHIHRLAYYDTLSGLPNREQFYTRLRQTLAQADTREGWVGLLLLDLDRFKVINDSLGHVAGDTLLQETAGRLSEYLVDSGFVARMGGDEFAILLPGLDGREVLNGWARAVLELFEEPYLLMGRELVVSASIGIALYPDDSLSADDLIKYADSAMHHVKDNGRNGYGFYERGLTIGLTERMSLEAELRKVLERGELELYYQPKVDLLRERITGYEALLRWRHPSLGLLTPDRFIGIAEETGIIVEIGGWVLRTACEAAVRWSRGGWTDFTVAVNLSVRQFLEHDLAGEVGAILVETGCRPEWLELEITENLLLEDRDETRATLGQLRDLGLKLAIDDFGTGYSALNYLARFPIDILKIDRSFVQGIGRDESSEKLVRGIVSLARSLQSCWWPKGWRPPGRRPICGR
ncbi:GGDEF domain-containing protein [Zobellella endophytica]|uniref:GGDEF domain-containing protein n=1 Tax=Zobellella endophytica TaxID=2116700 RepID=A0A2P7R4N1_9GAMM|nr:GGDEF domain-containing protein [Zobellella endophytica]